MNQLSPKQTRIYEFILSFTEQNGYPPSVREIADAVGLKSPSTVHFHLKSLEEAGVITRGAGKTRAITAVHRVELPPQLPENRVPLLGDVAAGAPILAQECVEEYVPFDTNGEDCFALRIRGESMLKAGILPGDLVIVRRHCPHRGRGHLQAQLPQKRPCLAAAGERRLSAHRRHLCPHPRQGGRTSAALLIGGGYGSEQTNFSAFLGAE